MANREHVEQLRKGSDSWSRWRHENKGIRPDLSNVKLWNVKLWNANLTGANLSGTSLWNTDLGAAYLGTADLSGTSLWNTNLDAAYLWRANLSNAKLIDVKLVGADLVEANLTGANLTGAKLWDANLLAADLRDANLGTSDLTGANLIGANLTGADLVDANLTGANLTGANLTGANLIGAELTGAELTGAELTGAELSKAKLNRTTIAKTNLCTTKGLATIQHRGPSHIEPFSVQLPQDGSALHFLRGVGVPDEWIDLWRTTTMHPIQYHSCFISYSSSDELLATRLHADLQAQGVRCWFAPEDMKIGDRTRQRIDEAIHVQDKLLLLLSANALESDWVETEVETALEKEQRQGRDVLFPIRLDESIMHTTRAWAKHLRLKRHIGDFTRWADPQVYLVAFERLLRDLKKR